MEHHAGFQSKDLNEYEYRASVLIKPLACSLLSGHATTITTLPLPDTLTLLQNAPKIFGQDWRPIKTQSASHMH